MFNQKNQDGLIRKTTVDSGFPPDLPIWITEMGSYSGDPADISLKVLPYQTESQQASDYFKRFIYPLSRGVKKIFPAFGVIEGFKHNNGYFDHTGIVYDGEGADDLGLGVKKLSYYTFKKMTELLEGSDWPTLTMLHDGTDNDHLYLFRIIKDGRPVHIAWWDHFDEPVYTRGDTKPVNINGLTGTAVTVTTVVPSAEIGKDVTDYETAFTVATYPISNGSATILLEEDPVIVEILNIDIRANGSDVPVNITLQDNLSVTVELDSGSSTGENADWWVSAWTPSGWIYYDYHSGTWKPGLSVIYQGPLFDFTQYAVLNTSDLPAGKYTFYFGIDKEMNGLLDYDQLYYDYVEVNISD